MRLSEAIALGRTLVKATPNIRLDGVYGCALGMADAACNSAAWGAQKVWPWLEEFNDTFPCGCKWTGWWERCFHNNTNVIAHLFNEHVFGAKDWTLDQLIDWVRSVEPDEEPSPIDAMEDKNETDKHGPLHGEVYQRQDKDKWVCIEQDGGFA